MKGYEVATGPESKVPVLWMDDEKRTISNLWKLLRGEDYGATLDLVGSLEEFYDKVEEGDYGAAIIDCKMDPHDRSRNGAAALVRVSELNKALPTFVYSAFLEDPLYSKYIERSYAVRIESKNRDFNRPLSKEDFFRDLVGFARNYYEVKEQRPEEVPFNEYYQRPEAYEEAVKVHWRKHGHWIAKDLERYHYAWGVVCGDQVVEGSDDLFDFPNERDLVSIGKDLNLIPFAYSRDILPEETGQVSECTGAERWSRTRFLGDWYPRLAVRIEGTCVEDDFDTGALQTLVAGELVGKGVLDFVRASNATHLGEKYRFFTKKVLIEIEDESGVRESAQIPVSVVRDWEGSVFQSVNRERRALIGRDILRAFDIEVVLDSCMRKTIVRCCGKD